MSHARNKPIRLDADDPYGFLLCTSSWIQKWLSNAHARSSKPPYMTIPTVRAVHFLNKLTEGCFCFALSEKIREAERSPPLDHSKLRKTSDYSCTILDYYEFTVSPNLIKLKSNFVSKAVRPNTQNWVREHGYSTTMTSNSLKRTKGTLEET